MDAAYSPSQSLRLLWAEITQPRDYQAGTHPACVSSNFHSSSRQTVSSVLSDLGK